MAETDLELSAGDAEFNALSPISYDSIMLFKKKNSREGRTG